VFFYFFVYRFYFFFVHCTRKFKNLETMQTKIKTLKYYLSIILLSSVLFMVGCSSSDDSNPNPPDPTPVNPPDPNPDPVPDPNPSPFPAPTAQDFNTLKKNALDSKVQLYPTTLGANNSFNITNKVSEKGTIISYWATNLKHNDVALVIGDNVDVEFIELYRKADFVTTGISTMALNLESGNLQMLETAGAIRLSLTKEGQPITYLLSSLTLDVSPSLTGGVKASTSLWQQDTTNQEGGFVWESGIATSSVAVVANKYKASVMNFLDWFNIARLWNDTRTKATSFSVSVPTVYNQSNSAVYISFDAIFGVGQIYYDTNAKKFSKAGSYIPIGQKGSVIFVTESAGKWVYAIKPFTATQNNDIEILGTDLQAATLGEIETAIEALP